MCAHTLTHKMVFNSVTAKQILMLALVSTSVFASRVTASKGKIGADYGLNGDNLPSPVQAVALILERGIRRVTVREASTSVTRAFADSGVDLRIGVANRDIPAIARSLTEAISWVRTHVVPFPTSGISAIIVGNRWLDHSIHDPFLLLPAMQNIHSALSATFLSGIQVTTSHPFSVLKSPTFPPSNATFAEGVLEVMRPLLQFLVETGSIFLVDIFPYRAYVENPAIPLELLLFQPTQPVRDPNTGLNYTNLYDLQLDAVYAAIKSLMKSSSPACAGCRGEDENVFAEAKTMGYPGAGGHSGFKRGQETHQTPGPKGSPGQYSMSAAACGRACEIATVDNARTYNQNLIRHVLKAKGTPANPSTPIQANIFEIFDEDLNPPLLQNFGFFFPNGTAAYPLNFHPK